MTTMVPSYGVWGGSSGVGHEWGLISPLDLQGHLHFLPNAGGDTPCVHFWTCHHCPSLSLSFCSFMWDSRTHFGCFCENRVCVNGAGGARWPRGCSDWCPYHRDWHPCRGYRSGSGAIAPPQTPQCSSSPTGGLCAVGKGALAARGWEQVTEKGQAHSPGGCMARTLGEAKPQEEPAHKVPTCPSSRELLSRASDRCPAAVHGAGPLHLAVDSRTDRRSHLLEPQVCFAATGDGVEMD